jgi:hypothetical protein
MTMRSPQRIGASAIAALTLAFASPARGQVRPGPTAPPCVRATIALVDPIDSANANPGDSFRFRIVDASAAPDGVAIPQGALGYGIVAAASHAKRGGIGGFVAIEPRFIALDNGTHVPVIADRLYDTSSARTGSSRNLPGVFGAVPFAGYLLGPYGFLHHGSDVTIPAGTRLPVLVGDQLALAACRVPHPGETTLPSRRQEQSPSASPSPAPTR